MSVLMPAPDGPTPLLMPPYTPVEGVPVYGEVVEGVVVDGVVVEGVVVDGFVETGVVLVPAELNQDNNARELASTLRNHPIYHQNADA